MRQFTGFAVSMPVFGPYSYIVEHVVLPHFTPFGYLVMITEASLGAFLTLVGMSGSLDYQAAGPARCRS